MQLLPKETIELYKKSPELLAARKLLFAECVEAHIKKQRKVIIDKKPSEVETETVQIKEWGRMNDLPFSETEMEFYSKWIKRFDVMYSYGILPQIQDVYAQKVS